MDIINLDIMNFAGASPPSVSGGSGMCSNITMEGLMLSIAVISLVTAFCGYKVYVKMIAVCGFLMAFLAVGVPGYMWYEYPIMHNVHTEAQKDASADNIKLILVLVIAVTWGIMGAIVCIKIREILDKILGFQICFLCGLSFWVLVVFVGMKYGGDGANSEYAMWGPYAMYALGIPTGICIGYKFQGFLKYAIMFTTSLVGSVFGCSLLGKVAKCFSPALGKGAIWLALAVVLTLLSTCVQIKFAPHEEEHADEHGEHGGKRPSTHSAHGRELPFGSVVDSAPAHPDYVAWHVV